MIKYLVETSLTGMVSCIIYFTLIRFLQKKATAVWKYRMCKICMLVFVIPVSFMMSQFSFLHLTEISSNSRNIGIHNRFEIIARYSHTYPYILYWAIIVLILVILYGAAYFYYNYSTNKNSTVLFDMDKLQLLQKVKNNLGIHKDVRLIANNGIQTSMTSGFMNYTIYLPVSPIEPAALELILSHELIHIKRRDSLWKLVGLIVKIIHWYNPFIYLLCYEMDHLCESSCDEIVVYNLDDAKRRLYGHAMVAMMTDKFPYIRQVFTLSFAKNKELVRKRITSMLAVTYPSLKTRCFLSFTLVMFLGSSIAFSCFFSPLLANASIDVHTLGIEKNACMKCNGDMSVSSFSSDWVPQNISRNCTYYAYGEDELYQKKETRKNTCLNCGDIQLVGGFIVEEQWKCFGHRP